LDAQGRVTRFNKSAEDLTGYAASEVLGKSLDFFFFDPAHYHDILKNLKLNKSYRNLHMPIKRRDGERTDMLMSISLIGNPGQDGHAAASITISKDMTREIRLEKALKESKEQLEEKVMQRTRDLECLSQRLAVLNQVASTASQSLELEPLLNNILQVVLELTGFPMGIISTFDEKEYIIIRAHRNVPKNILDRIRLLQKAQTVSGQAALTGTLQLGPPMDQDLTRLGIRLVVAVPLRAKGTSQGVMTLLANLDREVSDEERHLMLAIGVQAGWALENAELYEQVRRDVVKLKEVDRIKTEFIATVSHELRTPLTSIIGFISYAQLASQDLKKSNLARYLQVALENGQKLARMVEDLLAMQKLESGTLRFYLEPLELLPMLIRLQEELNPQLHAKEQRLILEIPEDLPPLTVDHEQFERVITNLILNAVKFSNGPGIITITAQHRPGEFTLTVTDTGIGMSHEVRERIFDSFYQAESSFTRKAGGVGLGLTIAKRIVEKHGGTLRAESEPNHGSRFTLSLPEQAPEPEVRP
ncbi:MAG: PAS domain-containing protein, partial [Candidatus Firestonebacteria bacterium]|nr:PAS domain-containing protein [Candidatus Firestonebacteria bacterium]